ncbi:PREDICTED: SAC3 domain-containing protein 1 [Poecilia mexicana]|uniref:SAC3/GANP/THP3 conserved domain-containing protein n=2 Tax=Poecilia mexicana TaxID=48701 RepID=A0A3B3YCE3_9TELE|nr:PREDICTED: SAC3 domain-containing protein 1 [Poecilia mexicana]
MSRRSGTRITQLQNSRAPSGGWRSPRNKKQCQSESKTHKNEVEAEDQGKEIKEMAPRASCQTMCPAQELRNRESQNRLHCFEVVPGTESFRKPKGDPLRAVKEYSRPAAGKDVTKPSCLRPPDVLLKTVCYLIDEIAGSTSLHPWTEVYSFVFDRLRSVKQDMIIQRLSGKDCVAILEPTVRFHIYASYRLCGEPLRIYDPRINDTHLQEYLSWLFDCYKTGSGPYPNQEEFQTLGLLYNLGSSPAAQDILELPERLRQTPSLKLALAINRAFLEGNHVHLLRLVQKLDFLQACALHRHLVTCRRHLLLIYCHGYHSRNCRFPLDRLAQLLSLEPSLTAELCQVYGIEVNQHNQVLFSKSAFTEPEQGSLDCKLYHSIVSEKQRGLTVKSIIHGCT